MSSRSKNEEFPHYIFGISPELALLLGEAQATGPIIFCHRLPKSSPQSLSILHAHSFTPVSHLSLIMEALDYQGRAQFQDSMCTMV